MRSQIELVGLAGSGKSTVSRLIRQTAANRSISIYDNQRAYYRSFLRANFPGDLGRASEIVPLRMMRYVTRNNDWGLKMQARFQATHPSVHRKMLQLLDKYTSSLSRKEWMITKYCVTESQYQATQEFLQQDEIVLFDEGFVHYAGSLLCPPQPKQQIEESDVRTYLDAIPLPNVCVITQARIEVCKHRMKTREKGRPGQYAHLSEPEFERYLERTERCRQLLKSALEDSGVDVFEIDTNNSIEETAAKVEQFIALSTNHM
jgi:thymidylate kinase